MHNDFSRLAGSDRRALLSLAALGAFATCLASKLAQIHFAANQTPFTDEWDDEAANTIKPYLEGVFSWRHLVQHDNEHLIFFTRPLTLLIFKISGYWDVVLPMIVNAILHSAILTLLLLALTRRLPPHARLAALLIGSAFCTLPFGYETTLLGFNTHFYTLLAFSFLAIQMSSTAEAWSPRWGLGVVMAGGAFLSLASGALVPAVLAGLAILQVGRGARSGARELAAILFLLGLSAVLVFLTPHIAENDVYRAPNFSAFLIGVAQLLAWPANSPIAALQYAPALVWAGLALKNAPPLNDNRWFNLGIMCWVLVQFAALSFGRNQIMAPRYMDFCVIGCLATLVALFDLAPAERLFSRRRALPALALGVVAALIFATTHHHGWAAGVPGVLQRRDSARVQEANLRAFLASHDPARLSAKTPDDLPYPDAERLKNFLDDPTIFSILPPNLNPKQQTHAGVERTKAVVIGGWWAWALLGLGAWSLVLLKARGDETAKADNRD